jgi:hypothetical protein
MSFLMKFLKRDKEKKKKPSSDKKFHMYLSIYIPSIYVLKIKKKL